MSESHSQRRTLLEAVAHLERSMIVAALDESKGVCARAASSLGVASRRLTHMMNSLGIVSHEKKVHSQESSSQKSHEVLQLLSEFGWSRLDEAIERLQRSMIVAALEKFGGDKRKAEKWLGVGRGALDRKMRCVETGGS